MHTNFTQRLTLDPDWKKRKRLGNHEYPNTPGIDAPCRFGCGCKITAEGQHMSSSWVNPLGRCPKNVIE